MRMFPQVTSLFESFVNAVLKHAPKTKLCFNTSPDSTLQAFQRVLKA